MTGWRPVDRGIRLMMLAAVCALVCIPSAVTPVFGAAFARPFGALCWSVGLIGVRRMADRNSQAPWALIAATLSGLWFLLELTTLFAVSGGEPVPRSLRLLAPPACGMFALVALRSLAEELGESADRRRLHSFTLWVWLLLTLSGALYYATWQARASGDELAGYVLVPFYFALPTAWAVTTIVFLFVLQHLRRVIRQGAALPPFARVD